MFKDRIIPAVALPRRTALRLAGLALLCAATHAKAQQPPAGAEVRIDNFTFVPAELSIKTGTRVTFVNADDIPHTVVDENGAFRSKALDTDDTFAFTFTKAGIYRYFCSLHPHMTGRITVT